MTTEGAATGQDVPLSAKLALDRTRLAHDRTLLAWVSDVADQLWLHRLQDRMLDPT